MSRREYRFCVLCAVATAIMAALMAMTQPMAKAHAETKISFINDIAPILKENCFVCHDAKKKSGKLDMSSYASFRKGGANDDPIVPGKPNESELYRLMTATDDKRMPPPDKGIALPPEKTRLVAQWIKEGATLDVGIEPTADLWREVRKRWQPPLPPATYSAPIALTAMAFTTDNKRLVIGGYYELTVWDVSTRKLVQRIRTRSERTYAMTFLPDGMLAVAAGRPGQEGDVRIYDLSVDGNSKNNDGRLDGVRDPRVLVTHLFDTDDCVLALAVSADGKQLAAGGCDRTARVWDLSASVRNAKLTHTVAIHADWVLGLAFTLDGKKLLTASRDKSAKCYDLEKQEAVVNFPDHQAPVFGVTFRNDGLAAYSVGADKMMYLWNLTSEKKTTKRATGHSDEVVQIVHHPSAPFVLTASADRTVRIWKEDANIAKLLSGLAEAASSLAVSPDGKLVAAGTVGGEVNIWQFPDGKSVAAFKAIPSQKQKKPRIDD